MRIMSSLPKPLGQPPKSFPQLYPISEVNRKNCRRTGWLDFQSAENLAEDYDKTVEPNFTNEGIEHGTRQ